MPRRGIIEEFGLADRVRSMLGDGLRAPAICDILSAEPDLKARLESIDRKNFYPSEIHKFLAAQMGALTGAVEASAKSDPAALILQSAKSQTLSTIDTLRDWEVVAKRCLGILEVEMDAYEIAKQSDPDARFPFGLVETTRKAVTTSLDGLRTLRGDANLQGLIRATNVTMQAGVSQNELHDILFAMGDVLGITHPKIIEAYSTVLMRKRQGRAIIDVPVAFEGKGAAMARHIEKKLYYRESMEAAGGEASA